MIIGNGERILFWKDNWHPLIPFFDKFGSLMC